MVVDAVNRPRGRPVAIDLFFRTLAAAHQERASAVVLSGTGSDGAEGQVEGFAKIARDLTERGLLEKQREEVLPTELLDLSRLNTGKMALNRTAVQWRPIVERIVSALRGEADAKPLTLNIEAGDPTV
ncbi:hypothetical protein OOT46_16045 [Aquabacterium sp. A7-Y]|uniref:chemotaxis protein CheB n=1 Tax=Aquabacterium sp. A7-Y TaxID=1349605 RepID=UPI00223DACDF|nr:chemotaxis protein CheB [Aquabacterium sp. A7-Y]MCW7539357.1 hypothetical protein [Aquabacterium sp. A7-Y]